MRSFFKIVVCLFLTLPMFSFSQVYEFDMLEMKYDQGHYRMVHRKAKRLLDNPAYDFSFLPSYYKAISGMRLAQNRWWLRRNDYIFDYTEEALLNMKKTIEGQQVLAAHEYELSELKSDLKQWLAELKEAEDNTTARKVQKIIDEVLTDVPYVIEMEEDKVDEDIVSVPDKATDVKGLRANIINNGKKHIGVPYKWAGQDPNGFDCSGFTLYLLETEAEIKLPRKASEQYQKSKKIKRKEAKPGDFVFFDSGSGISHVGIITNIGENNLEMIHASTSIGISIVDVDKSAYWKKRLVGFGTYLKD